MSTQVAYSNFDMATISTWQQLTRGLLKQVVAKRPEDGALSHRSLTPISSRNRLEKKTKTRKSSSGLQFRESEDVSKSWSWRDHVGDTSAYSVISRILLTNFNVVQISY